MEILYILFFIYLFNAVSFDLDYMKKERQQRIDLPYLPYAYKKIFANRIEYYNSEGRLHRTNGPAREYFNGWKVYIINGHKFSKEEFDKLQTI